MALRSVLGRFSLALAGAAVLLVTWAGAASADPAAPGDVRAEVTAVVPVDGSGAGGETGSAAGRELAAVTAEIAGGDSFLLVSARPGTELVVLGYEDEPYLRIRGDGTVEVNDRSPARWLNEARFAGTPVPADADPAATPAWRTIGAGGTTSWHDHRTHWMAANRPDPPVREWTVPLLVDGRAATIEGRYEYVPPPVRWPWWLAALALGAAAVALGRARGVRGATAIVLPSALASLLVGVELLRLPVAAGGRAEVLVAALAVLASAAAAARPRAPVAGPLLAGAGAALLVIGVRRRGVLDHAVLLTDLPAWVDRLSVAAALGAGAAAVVVGVIAVLQPAQVGSYQPFGTSASASGGPHEPFG